MHRTRLPLKTWLLAARIVATHSDGTPALQVRPGIGSCAGRWSIRNVLREIAEVDEASMPFREGRGAEGRSKQGRSAEGRMLPAGAVGPSGDGKPRRIRLKELNDHGADSLRGFIADVVESGARVVTGGRSGYSGLPEAGVIGDREAHKVPERAHRVFSNLKRWAMGVCRGLRGKHFRTCPDGFVFRWSRRRHRATSFDRLPGIGRGLKPVTYRDLVEGRARSASHSRPVSLSTRHDRSRTSGAGPFSHPGHCDSAAGTALAADPVSPAHGCRHDILWHRNQGDRPYNHI